MQSILSVNWKNFEAKVVSHTLYGLLSRQHLLSLFLANLSHLKMMRLITNNCNHRLTKEALSHLLRLLVVIFPIMHLVVVVLATISICHLLFQQNAASVI